MEPGQSPLVIQAQAPSPKAPWESKTMWASAIAMLAPLVFPPAAVWIAANPAVYSAALGAIFAGLRLVTHGKVSVS